MNDPRTPVMQAVSTRLPAVLVEQLTEEAARRGIKPSEVVRRSVEAMLSGRSQKNVSLSASAGRQITIITPLSQYQTANSNPVVEVLAEVRAGKSSSEGDERRA